MLFTIRYTFANCSNYITSLTYSYTYLTTFISNNNNCSETHFFSSLDSFRDAANLNHTLLPFRVAVLTSAITSSATSPITSATSSALLLLLLLLLLLFPLLPISCCWHICCGNFF
jgi:hypothetical protein